MLEVGAKMAKNQAPENRLRPAPQRRQRGRGQQRHRDRVRQRSATHAFGRVRAVVQHQRVRPDAEPQVMDDRAELRAKIRPAAHAHAETGRASAVAADDHQPAQQQPRGGQGHVQAAAAARPRGTTRPETCDRRGARSSGAETITSLLAMPSRQARNRSRHARRPALREPAPRMRAVERQQVEQPHQRLRPLNDVGHRLRLQRMDGPEQGDGETWGRIAPCGADTRQPGRTADRQTRMSAPLHRRQEQSAPKNAKQQQRRHKDELPGSWRGSRGRRNGLLSVSRRRLPRVAWKQCRPYAGCRESAGQGIIDGEGEVQQRPAGDGLAIVRAGRITSRGAKAAGSMGSRESTRDRQR